jgi:hypothetical protein
MGTTRRPLHLWVATPWLQHPALVAKAAQGHRITAFDPEADLVIHPRAHRWETEWWDQKGLVEALFQRLRRAS